jgi:hypothetical protein
LKKRTGQSLTPDEQKLVAGASNDENRKSFAQSIPYLKESEVQQAQVVLAAQDMVDKMQINVGRHHRNAIQRTACLG